ncbi:MAG TPA: helix-turn-helix domain-containing protein, partial [Acidobacteriota bacterium]|nr:helix-turn-helix domain-containing protein [Acidobacteriota bacterium]
MRQAFKFRIDPSPAVEAKLNWTLDVCRELYNAALQERRDAYRMCGVSLSYRRQADELPEVKEVRPDVALVHSQ